MSEHVRQADSGRCFACGTPIDQIANRELLCKGWGKRVWVLFLFQVLLIIIGGLLLILAALISLPALHIAGGFVLGFSVGISLMGVWLGCKLPRKR